MKSDEHGFTLPELVTVMAVSLLFASLVIVFGFNFWRSSALQQADQDTLISRLNAGDYLRQNLGESSGLITQNGLPDNHVLAADPNQPSGLYWVPIHAIPTTTPIGNTGVITPILYFRKLSISTSNTVIMNGTVPYEDEYVLYLNGTTKSLFAHAIANTNATSNRLVSSCPPAQATSSCPADREVATSVASIAPRYFSRTGTPLDYTSSTDPLTGAYNGPDFPIVEVLEMTITLKASPILESANATQNTTVIRIALRNS